MFWGVFWCVLVCFGVVWGSVLGCSGGGLSSALFDKTCAALFGLCGPFGQRGCCPLGAFSVCGCFLVSGAVAVSGAFFASGAFFGLRAVGLSGLLGLWCFWSLELWVSGAGWSPELVGLRSWLLS